ncbi:ABC transporter permease [Exiguobacterium indicum]|uniref:ABC transporter permease n=1 Tax=Exiguobacterium indicum TaxID=296995 RepID=UPI0007366D03|nr:ABC transporter permease subunit [Exiguobacterium indicum]
MKKTWLIFVGCLLLFISYTVYVNPFNTSVAKRLEPASFEHWLGTDGLGRDFAARLFLAGLISLGFSLLTVLLTACIGTCLGCLAGFYDGRLKHLIHRLEDGLVIFPDTVLALVIAGLFGASPQSLIFAILLIKWISYARLSETLVTETMQKPYISMARINGLTDRMILRRHILPPIIRQVVVLMSLDVGKVILFLSAFSYIGLGIQAPLPEWGAMLNEGRPYFSSAPRLMLLPGACIVLTVVATMGWTRWMKKKGGHVNDSNSELTRSSETRPSA